MFRSEFGNCIDPHQFRLQRSAPVKSVIDRFFLARLRQGVFGLRRYLDDDGVAIGKTVWNARGRAGGPRSPPEWNKGYPSRSRDAKQTHPNRFGNVLHRSVDLRQQSMCVN